MKVRDASHEGRSAVVHLFRRLRPLRLLPLWIRYLLTALLVIAAGAAWDLLSVQLADYRLILFFPVIILSGTLFNGGSGLFATLLSVLAGMWLIPPPFSLAIEREEILPMTLFGLSGVLCALMTEGLQVAVGEAIERQDALRQAMAALALAERRKHAMWVELGHRVRNDFSSLIGVLSRQAARTPEAASALRTAADRVRVLARVHSRLAASGDDLYVDSTTFLTDLADDLALSQAAERDVRIDVTATKARLPLEVATALGVITNELVTNAIKYAFPEGHGAIRLCFRRSGEEFVLTVRDDGIGPQETIQGSGLGSAIVRGLAAQLGGTFTRDAAEPGTRASVRFPLAVGAPHPSTLRIEEPPETPSLRAASVR